MTNTACAVLTSHRCAAGGRRSLTNYGGAGSRPQVVFSNDMLASTAVALAVDISARVDTMRAASLASSIVG